MSSEEEGSEEPVLSEEDGGTEDSVEEVLSEEISEEDSEEVSEDTSEETSETSEDVSEEASEEVSEDVSEEVSDETGGGVGAVVGSVFGVGEGVGISEEASEELSWDDAWEEEGVSEEDGVSSEDAGALLWGAVLSGTLPAGAGELQAHWKSSSKTRAAAHRRRVIPFIIMDLLFKTGTAAYGMSKTRPAANRPAAFSKRISTAVPSGGRASVPMGSRVQPSMASVRVRQATGS